MSKEHPECPLYNHNSCKDVDNPRVCALVRDDRICVRKHPQTKKTPAQTEEHSTSH